MKHVWLWCLVGWIAGVQLTATVTAQGVLIVEDPAQVIILPRPIPPSPIPRPVPPVPPRPTLRCRIAELDIQSKITDSAADVLISQTFVNDGNTPIEAAFVFPLPYDSAVTEMTLLVDGKEHPAKIMGADEARDYFESIVRRNRDPALLEWIGRGMFRTRVFPIPVGAKRTITLRYVQLLRRVDGLTDFLLPLATARYSTKPVDQIRLRISIGSNDEIRNVYSPSHGVKIERPTPKNAIVTFSEENRSPTTDFRLLYDVGRDALGAKLVSCRPSTGKGELEKGIGNGEPGSGATENKTKEKTGGEVRGGDDEKDGFFALFAAPAMDPEEMGKSSSVPKTVVLVVDRSGSLSGGKMEQTRAALRFILENLRENDLFNLVAYDSHVESFRPELQRSDPETKRAAIGFVDGLRAGGSTNIGEALRTAFTPLTDRERPTYVLFLTDGCPTTGVTNEAELLNISTELNRCGARLMVFGVGYDVNSRLLDRMARDGRGFPVYVRPEENIGEQVSTLWRRIESPVLTDVTFELRLDEDPDDVTPLVNRVSPSGPFDLFDGEQMIVVGRYRRSGAAKVTLTGTWNGEKRSWDFPVTLADSGNTTTSFVEPLWAMRRVTDILDEIDANGSNEELVKELVDLATRHGIVTPYTSFLADETSTPGVTAENIARSGSRLGSMSVAGGSFGVEQRRMRQNLRSQQNLSFDAASFADQSVVGAMSSAPSGSIAKRGGAIGPGAVQRRTGSAMGNRMGGGMSGIGGPDAPGIVGGMGRDTEAVTPSDIGRSGEEITRAATTMRRIGDRTFYLRDGVWIDGTLSVAQQKSEPVVLKQFTPEMFEFLRTHGEMTPYVASDEPILLNVSDQVYRIEP
ncbi:MAG: VIT and VWA domain-containing protein [Planctomycetia bacterium]|nr:VIT and VWA domain-containing protein [Planctomycetia bacterium]